MSLYIQLDGVPMHEDETEGPFAESAPAPREDARALVERIREGLCTEFTPDLSDDEAAAVIERYVESRLAAERERAEKAEAEVKRLREALEQVALPGVGLANIFEDHPEETIDKYYAAYKYCMRDIERRMTIARAALDGSAKEES